MFGLGEGADHPIGIFERDGQRTHRPDECARFEIPRSKPLASERNSQSLGGSPQNEIRRAEARALPDVQADRSVRLAPEEPTRARVPIMKKPELTEIRGNSWTTGLDPGLGAHHRKQGIVHQRLRLDTRPGTAAHAYGEIASSLTWIFDALIDVNR